MFPVPLHTSTYSPTAQYSALTHESLIVLTSDSLGKEHKRQHKYSFPSILSLNVRSHFKTASTIKLSFHPLIQLKEAMGREDEKKGILSNATQLKAVK